jgi:hypothetical protein
MLDRLEEVHTDLLARRGNGARAVVGPGLRLAGSVDRVVAIHLINAVRVTLCRGAETWAARSEHPHLAPLSVKW